MSMHTLSVEQTRKRQLAAKALELRISGMTHADIAEELGIPHGSTVAKMIQRTLERYEEPNVDLLRKLDSQRLDMLLRAVWTKAMGGDEASVGLAMRLIKQRADLFGLEVRVAHDPAGVVYNVTFQPGSQQIQAEQVAVSSNVTPGLEGGSASQKEPITTKYILTEQEKAPPPLTDDELFELEQTALTLLGDG